MVVSTLASVGSNLYLPAIDDFSGYAAVKPLRYHSEAIAKLKEIITGSERQQDRRVKAVCTDGNKEYTAFHHWCSEEGIRRKQCHVCHQRTGRATEQESDGEGQSHAGDGRHAKDVLGGGVRHGGKANMGLQGRSQAPCDKFHRQKSNIQNLCPFGCKRPTARYYQERRPSWGSAVRRDGCRSGTKGWSILHYSGKNVIRCNVVFVEDTSQRRNKYDDDDVMQTARQPVGENSGDAQTGAVGEQGGTARGGVVSDVAGAGNAGALVVGEAADDVEMAVQDRTLP
jgi:hypothetical protein